MSSFSMPRTMFLLLVAGVGVIVLAGCQKNAIEASQTEGDIPAVGEAPEPGSNESVDTVPSTPPPAVDPSKPLGAPADSQTVSAASPVAEPAATKPALVTVPAGTILVVELDKSLSSHTSEVGEGFRAFLTQDVAAQGQIALPQETIVIGRVTEASPAKKIGGRARLSLDFYSLHLPTGQQAPLQAVFAQAGKSQTTKDAAIIGGSTLGGAIIGHAVDKGEGTAIGAIVGGLAGAAIANETRGKPVEVPAGTVLTLEVVEPVTVDLLR